MISPSILRKVIMEQKANKYFADIHAKNFLKQ